MENDPQDDMMVLQERKVTRPPNAFMLFGRERRSIIAKQHPGLSNKEISKLLGKEWHSLSSEEKEKYFKTSRDAKQMHKIQNPGAFLIAIQVI